MDNPQNASILIASAEISIRQCYHRPGGIARAFPYNKRKIYIDMETCFSANKKEAEALNNLQEILKDQPPGKGLRIR